MTAIPSPASDTFDRDPLQRTLLWKTLQAICRVVTSTLFELNVYGKEHIPRSGGALIVSNHQSYLDPILLAVQLNRPVSFMARSGLFDNRFFGWLIRQLNAFPVRQGTGDVGAIKETIRRLQQGHMLVIYPEGSRTEDGDLQPIEPGAGLVVKRVPVPVIPAYIEGSWEAWMRGTAIFRPHKIRVIYGPPLDTEGMKPREVVQLMGRRFHELRDELHQRVRRQG